MQKQYSKKVWIMTPFDVYFNFYCVSFIQNLVVFWVELQSKFTLPERHTSSIPAVIV